MTRLRNDSPWHLILSTLSQSLLSALVAWRRRLCCSLDPLGVWISQHNGVNLPTANERSRCHTCAAYINPSRPSDARNVAISSDDGLSPDHRQAIN